MISNFVKWLKGKSILEEGVWGNWNYTIPSDKKAQMYDFYMLEYLLPPGIHLSLTTFDFGGYDTDEEAAAEDKDRAAKGLPPDTRLVGDMKMTVEDKFNYALYEAANKLLPFLKKELLEVVFFSLTAELKHLWDHHDNKPQDKMYMIDMVKKELGPQYASLLKKYVLTTKIMQNSGIKPFMRREIISDNLASSNQPYKDSHYAVKQSGGSEEDWVTLLHWLYKNAAWSAAFGGSMWAQIAEGWLHLYRAKNPSKIIAYIDHVYDLQHNTDTVFNKVKSYAKEGHYGWVKEALDHKRHLVSPHEMIEHVSPAMKELALIGIKLKTEKSWGDFEEEWPEIVKKKAEIHNQINQSDYEKALAIHKKKKAEGQYSYEPNKPKNLNVEDYEKYKIKHSDHPWSVHHFTKAGKANLKSKIDDVGATNIIPDFSKIQIGDQVSDQWPRVDWNTVINKGHKNNRDVIYYQSEYWGTSTEIPMGMEYVKGYRSKAAAEKAAAAAKIAPAENLPSTTATLLHKDINGTDIKVGDSVTKPYSKSHTGEQALVKYLEPNGFIRVQWSIKGTERVYPAQSLLVAKSIPAPSPSMPAPSPSMPAPSPSIPAPSPSIPAPSPSIPAPSPSIPAPSPSIPAPSPLLSLNKFNIGDIVSTKSTPTSNDWLIITGKELGQLLAKDINGNQRSILPFEILAHSKKASIEPPKPKVIPAVHMPSPSETAKNLWDTLPKMPKYLRIARVMRGMKSNLSFDATFEILEKVLKIELDSFERAEIKKKFQEEDDKITYYKSKGYLKIPSGLTKEQAWNAIQQKFPDPPHVYVDPETTRQIKGLLLKHEDTKAIDIIKNYTQFGHSASIGLAVRMKLELYLEEKFTNPQSVL